MTPYYARLVYGDQDQLESIRRDRPEAELVELVNNFQSDIRSLKAGNIYFTSDPDMMRGVDYKA